MNIQAIIRLELSYWLVKYIKNTGKSPQDIAKESKVPIREVKKAIQGELVVKKSMEALCECIGRPYEMLKIPPVDDPVFLCFTENLTNQYRNLRENRNKNDIHEMTKNMSNDYHFEDLERISAWLRYLVSNPDSTESRSVVEPIIDLEEQLKTRTSWLRKFKKKVWNIRTKVLDVPPTANLAIGLSDPESPEDKNLAEKRVKASKAGKKK